MGRETRQEAGHWMNKTPDDYVLERNLGTGRMLAARYAARGPKDIETQLVDCMVDIMHLARTEGLDFETLIAMAVTHHVAEWQDGEHG